MSFTPTFYSGRGATSLLFLAFKDGHSQADIPRWMRHLEGSVDAPWCALILLQALKPNGFSTMSSTVLNRLIVLANRATKDNKPQWVEDALTATARKAVRGA